MISEMEAPYAGTRETEEGEWDEKLEEGQEPGCGITFLRSGAGGHQSSVSRLSEILA